MYAYVPHNSCCTCLFDCTFLWLFVIFFSLFFSWYNKKRYNDKKKKKKKKKNNWKEVDQLVLPI